MDLNLAGKRAIVTGASKGIGFSCAEALAAEGVEVVIVSRDAARLSAAREKLGDRVRTFAADLSKAEERASSPPPIPRPTFSSTTPARSPAATSSTSTSTAGARPGN